MSNDANDFKENEPRVVISGGGPAGLLAGILLSELGIKSIVVEKKAEPDEFNSKSYSMVINGIGQAALERGGCLEAAKSVGNERNFMYLVDGVSGEIKAIPRKQPTPGLGLSRPLLVECIEKIAKNLPNVTIQRGAGVDKVTVTANKPDLIQVQLDNGKTLTATHVIGADGKWSKVRQSIPELDSQGQILTTQSFGVSMFLPTAPEGWKSDGTYIIKPPEECLFYTILARLPTGGASVSMVCSNQTIEKYPWLERPTDQKVDEKNGNKSETGTWEDEYSPMPEQGQETTTTTTNTSSLAQNLEQLYQEKMPAFHALLADQQLYQNARINRHVSWLQMTPAVEAKEEEVKRKVSYSTSDGRVALIGDACHAMTPSLGQGGNLAMESAVKLADAIGEAMKEQNETVCTVQTLSQALKQYGLTRPPQVQPIQEQSAAINDPKK